MYEKGKKAVKRRIEKWNIFKSVNYLMTESVNNKELLVLYKPTKTSARSGSKEKIGLPVLEYEKLKGTTV